mmetsp:Transcript_61830/g.130545  ORF Transcript_61830/g.130545 Transcript_61830/m.130545 type:complete len:193 (-) Transcript_61830:939-1517(-)
MRRAPTLSRQGQYQNERSHGRRAWPRCPDIIPDGGPTASCDGLSRTINEQRDTDSFLITGPPTYQGRQTLLSRGLCCVGIPHCLGVLAERRGVGRTRPKTVLKPGLGVTGGGPEEGAAAKKSEQDPDVPRVVAAVKELSLAEVDVRCVLLYPLADDLSVVEAVEGARPLDRAAALFNSANAKGAICGPDDRI